MVQVAEDAGGVYGALFTGENSSTQDAVFDANHRDLRSFVGSNPGNDRFRVGDEGDDGSVASSIGLR